MPFKGTTQCTELSYRLRPLVWQILRKKGFWKGRKKSGHSFTENSRVGPKSLVSLMIEGINASALLDTGSQVTIVFRSFYEEHLSHLTMLPADDVKLWGLGSQTYPVEGVIKVKILIPQLDTRNQRPMNVEALVCPNLNRPGVPIILGTNTPMVRDVFQGYLKEMDSVCVDKLNELEPALKEECHRLALEAGTGQFHYWGPKPVDLLPGEMKSITAVAVLKEGMLSGECQFCLESLPEVDSTKGWTIMPEVKDWRRKKIDVFAVTIHNRSPIVVRIEHCEKLGVIHLLDEIRPITSLTVDLSQEPPQEIHFDLEANDLPPEWKDRLQKSLKVREGVFSKEDMDVGCAKNAQHTIRLNDSTPFRERSRRLAPRDIEDVRDILHSMEEAGIIQESRSPYASPIVVVRKKNGSVRLCVDYRTLNKRTIPDQYTLPRIEDLLNALNGSKWFSVLDLRSGYYQVPMNAEDQEKTAFICPLGFFQFTRMPQGVTGAPATFQRLMEKTLGDMSPRECLVYLDDIIVFGRTPEEHENRLLKVIDRLQNEGLKLSLDKCKFAQTSVTYVGHIVSAEGVATDQAKVEVVVNWPRPNNIEELRSFLGFCGYYRRFVEGYSKIARSLHDLLKGDSREEARKTNHSKEPIGEKWTQKCEDAFQLLKRKMTEAPVLAYADPSEPYILHVDASLEGLGGVLHQAYPGGLRPVAYISRSLTGSEKNYPIHKLEFLALKWAIVDKLHDYLYGANFEVRTDNNPLTYILTTAKLDATGHRWLAALSNYDFSLKYKPGPKNVGADALSRRPGLPTTKEDEEWVEIPGPGVRALCQTSIVEDGRVNFSELRFIDSLSCTSDAIPEAMCLPVTLPEWSTISLDEKRRAQAQDPVIGRLMKALEKRDFQFMKILPINLQHLLKREWNRFHFENGLLFRIIQYHDHPGRKQLVLPQKYRGLVLRSLHDFHGHLGIDKTFGLIQDRFYWPYMKESVEVYCRRCRRCIQRKTLPTRVAPMGHLKSSGPMDLVCMDFLCIEPDSTGNNNVLVITDHYTRYAQAYPTKDQKAVTVAKLLWQKFFAHYGFPKRLHTDQGRDFESRLIKEMLKLLQIEKSRTTPYHPEGDALPERFNRTLLDMLGTLKDVQKRRWSQHVETLVHAYNCTRHESTGFSPYFLMFGREARLPIDIRLGVSSDGMSHESHYQYVKNLKTNLQRAYELAERATDKINENNKRRYDSKIRYKDIQPGDKVLLRNLGVPGKHKLADRWRDTLFEVVSKIPGIPVYRIKGPEGRIKTWHRNHLLPVTFSDCNTEQNSDETSKNTITQDHSESDSDNPRECSSSVSPKNVEQKIADSNPERDWWTVPETPLVPSILTPSPLNPESPSFIPHSPTQETVSAGGTEPPPVTSIPQAGGERLCDADLHGQPYISLPRGRRNRRPPRFLTYDNIGEPTYSQNPHTCTKLINVLHTLAEILNARSSLC
uniref:Gypsy retrotransposon integrase-like protein 1 n=1 Tax=Leptobrachium leishanense TaxID=445787 RepID=A0A8C5QC51_9ANUR